jgi:hypothetical protein
VLYSHKYVATQRMGSKALLCLQGRVQIAVTVLEPELPALCVGAYVEHCSAHGMLETTQSVLMDHVRLPGGC